MKLKINYIDNEINFENDMINVVEIENKNYFYRVISDLINVQNSSANDEIIFIDDSYNELNYGSKLNVIIDYFNIDFNSKKNISLLIKKMSDEISNEEKNNITILYNKMIKILKKHFNDYSMNISINDNFDIESLIKTMKIEMCKEDSILNNIMLLIEITNEFNIEQTMIFVNLKQYLNCQELIELYKYSIYNNVKIMLVDSQSYGITLEYEKKLIVDENLDEFMI